MEEQANRVVELAWTKFQNHPPNKRFLIFIAGIPGSGKTTLSQILTTRLNNRSLSQSPTSPPPAVFLPMDGYHYTRETLSSMPDPAQAHARRGAAFTFDAPAFHALVQHLSQPLTPNTQTIAAPAFDHALKDPSPGALLVLPSHRLIVLEGNYLHLDRPPWRDAAALSHLRVFVNVDEALARRRLVPRHVAAGIVADLEAADRRVTENDLVNGADVLAHRLPADVVVESLDDEEWARRAVAEAATEPAVAPGFVMGADELEGVPVKSP